MTLMDTYIRKCTDLGTRARRRKFRAVESQVKEDIVALLSVIDMEDEGRNSPYVITRIDRRLWYFAKVVGGLIYPLIVTSDELQTLGYRR